MNLFLLGAWLLISPAAVQVHLPPPQKTISLPQRQDRIVGMPFANYTPETRLAGGLGGSYIFRLSKKAERPSSISPLFIATQLRQFKLFLQSDLFLRNSDFHALAYLKLEHYPDRFYGIGNRNRDEAMELFTSRGLRFNLDLLRRILPDTYAGLRYGLATWSIRDTEPGRQLASGRIAGSSGGTTSGLGLLFTRDSRDSIYFPRRGQWIDLSLSAFSPWLGSGFSYRSMSLNARAYVPLPRDAVLALQGLLTIQGGTVPFLDLAYLGGQSILRGYYWGQYRDRNLAVLQAEYRRTLVWRLKLAAFAGIGDVAPQPGKLSLPDAKWSAGLGLRYLFLKSEQITLRFDVAFGQHAFAVYFSIFEAF